MMSPYAENFHNRFCGNRSVGTACFFVAFWAMIFFTAWRGLGKSHLVHSGAFFLFYQANALLVVGVFFALFKCLRERVVLGLSLLIPVRVLCFAVAPSMANWSGFAYRVDLIASAIALAVSISMLISALRHRNRRSLCQSI
jgi:hypothetical protein